jgi:DNA-binding CsgD family transcriptional regulator
MVGRAEELARLTELVSPPHAEGRALLLGDPGAGKTVLLSEAARQARSAGMRVLAAVGRKSEQDLALAGLHQLLRPALDRVDGLPARPAEALLGAFGLSDQAAPRMLPALRHRRPRRRGRALRPATCSSPPVPAGCSPSRPMRRPFRRLCAAPWTRRPESELRACGVAAPSPTTSRGPSVLDELTPQQREIAILASHGLTNGEIAGRLFLSPRTVASHLHRSYPKLGIAGRHQLRNLLDPAGTPHASA